MTNSDKKCGPTVLLLKAGESIVWCKHCGSTCADDCVATGQLFVAPDAGYFWFCQCGNSARTMCDGSHKKRT